MIWNSFQLALRSILRNLLRSSLTILGVVIGVAAVITMVNAGQGATAQVSEQIAGLGRNLIMVMPGQRRGPGSPAITKLFELDDARAVQRELGPLLEAVAPTVEGKLVAVNGADAWSTSVVGTNNEYFDVRDWELGAGRTFHGTELGAGAPVCILGETVRNRLFGRTFAIGRRIRLGNVSCEVIGVLASKGQTTMGRDQDDCIIIPLRTYWRRFAGNRDVAYIQLSARDGVDTSRVTQRLELLFQERRRIRPGSDNDFHVRDMQEIAKTLAGTTRVLTALLGSIAGVSLLVGGIGIMNIMLVSVTERTREIGIRQAIGALERDVLLQFLVEAVVLSSLGGLLGIAIAFVASYAMSLILGGPFYFDVSMALIAFVFSALVGILFGYLPARKAARLDPIEALRRE